ncbi:MAG TPA: SCP2 sterol-binding domain-containing protein [Acidimicrobiales bacterium]|jgi:hypothetical protein|nr:SCP2 sterol-binding domain-containing protein [Acidimicrobiales bacterium]
MATFLSPEWVDELDRAASASGALATATKDIALTVQQIVTADAASPNGDASQHPGRGAAWHVIVDHGLVRVRPGQSNRPDVTFTQDRATAVRVGRGELSAQAAFMLGKLRVDGDVALLMTHHVAFAGLDDVFADVRTSTTY